MRSMTIPSCSRPVLAPGPRNLREHVSSLRSRCGLTSNQIISTFKRCGVSWLLTRSCGAPQKDKQNETLFFPIWWFAFFSLGRLYDMFLLNWEIHLWNCTHGIYVVLLGPPHSHPHHFQGVGRVENSHITCDLLKEMEIDTERLEEEFQAMGEEYNFDRTELNQTLDMVSQYCIPGIDWEDNGRILFVLLVVFWLSCVLLKQTQGKMWKLAEVEEWLGLYSGNFHSGVCFA